MDEFGPLTSADGSENGASRPDNLNWQEEKTQLLQDFGLKRARFKELFLQKEQENKTLQADLDKLRAEMADMKAAVALAEYGRQDEADLLQRKYTEELSSLQHIMRASIDEASQSTAERYEDDRQRLIRANQALEDEIHELKTKLSKEREGFMATVAKSIKRVGTTAAGTFGGAENLEDSMRRAQEDSEMLRSVVEPLEEEVKCMKDKYRASIAKCDFLEAENRRLSGNSTLASIPESGDVDSRVRELSENLKVEKASRSDLELYVAVLNTQKQAAQQESDNFKKQLNEVAQYLEAERKQHRDLKTTWQMANDQFLEAQRLLMKDMRRMESLLSAEQQRQLAELQKKDAEQKPIPKITDLGINLVDGQSPKLRRSHSSPRDSPHRELLKPGNDICSNLQKADSKTSLNSIRSDDYLGLNEADSSLKQDDQDISMDASPQSKSPPQCSPERTINVPNLTAAQQRALTDPRPDGETDELLAVARSGGSYENDAGLAGKRLVSETEWQMLQDEIQSAREKLGRPCDMCSNYEAQLQNIQQDLSRKDKQYSDLERAMTTTKKALEKEQKYREELEESLKNASENSEKNISNLVNKVYESEKFLIEISQQYQSSNKDLQENLKKLTHDREAVQKELTRLQEENDQLIGRHSKHAQALQEETINLPDTMDEMQLVLLRYREDIITAKVAKEQTEDSLKSEIMFVKDQLLCEQQEKSRIEETLSADVANLQEQLAMLQSVKSELDRESKVRRDVEVRLRDCESASKSHQAKARQVITALQRQVEEHSNARKNLEHEQTALRAKIQTLQIDMENSEAVQRDFVKLSQSLQIQLEKIRQAETEVRWQHEEDVEDCNNCRQAFSVARRKHHCRHCGKIFCSDCTAKSVPSGPHSRASKVCDVCHTILVKDATPYFSTEPPQTPD